MPKVPAFRILGPLEVEGARPLGPKQRTLLASLLLAANRAVSRGRLIDDVWGDDPPATAAHAVQVYVSQLRKALPPQARIATAGDAYRLEVDEDEVDALRFESLVERGRQLLREGDAGGAASVLREAEALWRGPSLPHLEELRLTAIEERVEADLLLGHDAELVPELEALVRDHPLRERLRRHLMLALYRAGRQAKALELYRETRRALVEELGIEPGDELRRLESAILSQDPGLLVEPAELRARRRLPTPVTALVGRRREVEEVCELLRGDARLAP